MEIKLPGAMPVWLSRILNDLEIYPESFLKYGKELIEGEAYTLTCGDQITEITLSTIATSGGLSVTMGQKGMGR